MHTVVIINSHPGEWKEFPFKADDEEQRRLRSACREASTEGQKRYHNSVPVHETNARMSWDCPKCGEHHEQEFDFLDRGAVIEAYQYRSGERIHEGYEATPYISGSFATYIHVRCPVKDERYRICITSGIPG